MHSVLKYAFIFFGFIAGTLLSQRVLAQFDFRNNLVIKKVAVSGSSLQFDTLSLVAGSFRILETDTFHYELHEYRAELIWKVIPAIDSIQISYRRLPYNFGHRYFNKDLNRLDSQIVIAPYYYDAVDAAKQNQSPIDFGNVDYSGTFARAISFGNNQDLVLNSQFNLQLEGDLGDSIRLSGAITDNTIPFQPEGNTQQIQEFDRVFLQLRRKQTVLTVGDHDVRRPESYFMNFYKRVQGAMVSGQLIQNATLRLHSTLSTSLAKGKFVRNTLTAIEGNQGPYKLTGPNGENFFIVLAGTERVYIDGIQMKRGEDQDYIIDYNTAEITFMPRRIITKDLRLVVEFEFSDRNYLNSLIYTSHHLQLGKKLTWDVNVYSNQDAKNQSIQQSLDSSQKRFLASIGDSIQNAQYPSARFQDTFSNNLILYRKTDTLVNGILYPEVYVFSQNPDSAKWLLAFSFVGSGQGNYTQSISSANGRVYAWKAPLNGIKQGDYEPVQVLVTPKKQQMLTSILNFQADSTKLLRVETALSQYDPNLFSPISNSDHTGFASRLTYQETRILNKQRHWILEDKINYEYVNQKFRALERFRAVEFARDWNSGLSVQPANEHVASAGFVFKNKSTFLADLSASMFIREGDFRGLLQMASISGNHGRFRYLLKNSYSSHRSRETKGYFVRPTLELEQSIRQKNPWITGLRFFLEHNPLRSATADTLLANSFSFDATSLYLKNENSGKRQISAEYTLRRDRARKSESLKESTLGHTVTLNGYWRFLESQEFRLTSAYRKLIIRDTLITNLEPDESLLGRFEYQGSIYKGLVSATILFEMGSGQETKREFTYIEVPAGQGVYVWRDYNGDNLKQLNEFEIALFQDEKRYIKVFTPTNQYVKAKYSIYNQSISIQPGQLVRHLAQKNIYRKLLNAIYFQSSWQLNNRFIGRQGIAQYNPFLRVLEDSFLLNNSSNLVNSLLINRFSAVWGADYIYTIQGGKTLLNYGIDARQYTEQLGRLRFYPHRTVTLTAQGKWAERVFRTQFLESRNFIISMRAVEPGISILLLKNQLRTGVQYKYEKRSNAVQYGGERAFISSFSADFRYNIISSGSVNLKATYTGIRYQGNASSAVGYAMLDGLTGGKNWLWNAGFDKRVSKNIEMNLEYEGRKTGTGSFIHTGRASVRAIF